MPDAATGELAAVLALDVGGTDIKGAVVASTGVVVSQTTSTCAQLGPEASVAAVLRAVDDLYASVPAGYRARGVGLVVPGTVDEEVGLVSSAENLDWVDLPIARIVQERSGLPVGFGHDVRSAGLAEWQLGAGRGRQDLAYISIGTGIAAALILGGTMLVGHGYAGEIGHGGATEGAPCPCGGRGCPETFASAAGMARRYGELSGKSVPGAKEVLEAARGGDPIARRVWDEAVTELGSLIAQVVRVTGLATVVVGGGLVRAGSDLMDPLAAAVRRHLTIHPEPELILARLGSSAGTYGAALLGWNAAGLSTSPTWAADREQEESA